MSNLHIRANAPWRLLKQSESRAENCAASFSFVFYNTRLYITMLFRTLPCSYVLRRSLRFGTSSLFSFVTIPECRFLYFDS